MIQSDIKSFRIAGIAAAVPKARHAVHELEKTFGSATSERLIAATGVFERRIASDDVCTTDLCLEAARRLLATLNWSPGSVGGIVFVSQTPDYRLPASACLLQHQLNLSKSCVAYDVNLGCSGYVYGLWLAAQATQFGVARILLCVGDTISKLVNSSDRATAALFGDCGTVTAIEYCDGANGLAFCLGTDGSGWQQLFVEAGGLRNGPSIGKSDGEVSGLGIDKRKQSLHMDGAEVFAFTQSTVPSLIAEMLAFSGLEIVNVDAFVLHQASKFMIDSICRRCGIDSSKVPLSLDSFGNTSSASIPLTIAHQLNRQLSTRKLTMVFAGFGVGWSWAAAAGATGPFPVLPVIEIP
jgi:3-oxoacyl-[acyl-carrier-protein] synthase-3